MKKVEPTILVEEYQNGKSLYAIAKKYNMYPMTVRRTLMKYSVELREDKPVKGAMIIKNGDAVLEWAKSQDHLVTKQELANFLGKTRINPTYFIKYPELGKYMKTTGAEDLIKYKNELYNWLKEHHIPYKPNDRTTLNVALTALLLGEYKNVAIQIDIKPKTENLTRYKAKVKEKLHRAEKKGIFVILLTEKDFEDLNIIKTKLKEIS